MPVGLKKIWECIHISKKCYELYKQCRILCQPPASKSRSVVLADMAFECIGKKNAPSVLRLLLTGVADVQRNSPFLVIDCSYILYKNDQYF